MACMAISLERRHRYGPPSSAAGLLDEHVVLITLQCRQPGTNITGMTGADYAIIASTVLCTPTGLLMVLNAMEKQQYKIGFLSTMLVSSPIGVLGTYFFDDATRFVIIGCWIIHCVLIALIIWIEAYVKLGEFVRSRISNIRYTRDIDIEDFRR